MNLALEKYLFELCEKEQIPILYLWQNDNTVVVGRNQNIYTECNLDYVSQNNIKIARRTTGGGAVFHDKGNLNFSFIVPKHLFNISFTTNLILKALNSVGVAAERNGRNDICLFGNKISGNAYYSSEKAGLHHGTILFKQNLDKMASVLKVSDKKLSKKGIKSVRARTADIASFFSNVTLKDIKTAIFDSFCDSFSSSVSEEPSLDFEAVNKYKKQFQTREWITGPFQEYDYLQEELTSFGLVKLLISFRDEKITNIMIDSDSLDVDFIEEANNSLIDFFCKKRKESVTDFLSANVILKNKYHSETNELVNLIIKWRNERYV